MKNHEIRFCSIPRSECSNKYYEFISCLCMAEQSNELLIENRETCPNWFCSIPRSECTSIKDMCLIDNAKTYTILKSNKFFSCLIMRDINFSIIYSTTYIFEDSRRANILLPRSWISFKDICLNGYYIETNNEKDMKYLYISTIELKKKCILEKLSTFSYGL